MRRCIRHLVFVAAVVVGAAAHAEPVVLAVDGKDIYVELGAKDGIGAGSELELLHEVTARDPRTGALLRDHFVLGTLSVVKSGERISVARADADLRKRVLAGDRVRLVSAKRTFVDPWAEQVAASKQPGTPADASDPTAAPTATTPRDNAAEQAEHARQALLDTLGKPLDKRIERWLEYLRAHPQSPYRVSVQREIATLRKQQAARETALTRARGTREDRSERIEALAENLGGNDGPILSVADVDEAQPGRAIDLAFTIMSPRAVGDAWLFVRAAEDPGFRRIALVRDGDAYLRGRIDAALVRAPAVHWYVEIATTNAEPLPVLGTQRDPRVIVVEFAAAEAPIESGRSHIDLHVDYVDFDGGLANGFDQYYQAELDFMYRFIKPVYAMRLGFGTLSGTGGPKDMIDAAAEQNDDCVVDGIYWCAELDFTYVFAELEFRIRKNVALMIRPQAGLLTSDRRPGGTPDDCRGSDTEFCDFITGFGVRGRIRLGDEAGTNLVIGIGATRHVGTLLEATYQWRPAPVVPVQLSVQVTDQPVLEDFGVRLIADVGWRQLSWFYPSARLSYQARDIDHAGVSGGVAMNFDW